MSQVVDTALGTFAEHLTSGFTTELAKQFAELPEPNPAFQLRLKELAEKANEGALSPAEAGEYEQYIQLMDFVALLRLKAQAHSMQNGS